MFIVSGASARREGALKTAMGDGGAFMVAGHKIYGGAAVGHLLEGLKCHLNQPGRDFAAV